ncbi:MAG: HEAT repeat domain-containing protein, partial [Planctomycetales bacterium]
GVMVYRGGAYPSEFYGQVFVGDGQNNLIHRRALVPDGVPFKSLRVDQQTEFIRTPDIWFRPVNLVNAPDGTLYCCDMSREVLESIHVPLDVVRHLDLKSGRNTGRIYRIAPPGFKSPPPPRLSHATTAQLLAALESPHGWWRDTAQRLLYERQDRSAAAALRRVARESSLPQARLLAAWSLQGLGELDDATRLALLGDEHAGVRENGVRLAESRLGAHPQLLARVAQLADDENPRIRFQVAFSLGESTAPESVAALARLARRDGADPWIRTAVLSSVAQSADRMLIELLQIPTDQAPAVAGMLGQLAQVVGVRNQPQEVAATLDTLAKLQATGRSGDAQRLLFELGTGMKRSGAGLAALQTTGPGADFLRDALTRGAQIASRADAPLEQKIAAVGLLSCAPSPRHRELLGGLLAIEQPEPLQLAAIKALADDPDPQVGALLLERWASFVPEIRRAALGALLSREEGTRRLLEAALRDDVSVADVEPTRREMLVKHKNETIRRLAGKVFGAAGPGPRKGIVDEYQAALKLRGDLANGGLVFEKNCAACHQLAGKGFNIGPNLASSPSRDPGALLTHILDPNQYVLPNYLQYVVVDKNGRSYTGLLAAQSATSITLKKEKDEMVTVLRGDIDELTSSNKSLMPEGLEKEISLQGMADLIAYLNDAAAKSPGDPNAERDFGTLPGLVETERSDP